MVAVREGRPPDLCERRPPRTAAVTTAFFGEDFFFGFANVALHDDGITDGGFSGDERERVYRKRRACTADVRKGIGTGDYCAEAEAGESCGFRKGADNIEVGIFMNPIEDGYAAEFPIGFIDDHCRV